MVSVDQTNNSNITSNRTIRRLVCRPNKKQQSFIWLYKKNNNNNKIEEKSNQIKSNRDEIGNKDMNNASKQCGLNN